MIVKRHIVVGEEIEAEDIGDGSTLVPTLSGEFVTVTKNDDGNVTVTSSLGEANVTQADVRAENGIVHVINGIL